MAQTPHCKMYNSRSYSIIFGAGCKGKNGGKYLMKSFAGMRTLDEAYRELKQLDSGTAVSKCFIRQLALSGKIPTVMCGRKRLINFDGLLDYLNEQGRQPEQDSPAAVCGIRPVW